MDENTYTLFVEKLGKLQRNEAQMTDTQKLQYEAELKALKKKIAGYAAEMARFFITGGTLFKKDEPSYECVEDITKIVQSERTKEEYREAMKILFRTYDVNRFFEALLPTHYRVLYEGYAPYWLEHCKPYIGKAKSGEILTYWNDLIEMGWSEECGLWLRGNGNGCSMAMPPTQELVRKKYFEELARISWKG